MKNILSSFKRRALGVKAMRRRLFRTKYLKLFGVYVKSPTLGALAATTQYEGVIGDEGGNPLISNVYLLDDSTGKLYYSDIAGTLVAENYNCAYSCEYVPQHTYTLGAEVIGLDRPINLYATNSGQLIWTLT